MVNTRKYFIILILNHLLDFLRITGLKPSPLRFFDNLLFGFKQIISYFFLQPHNQLFRRHVKRLALDLLRGELTDDLSLAPSPLRAFYHLSW